jgi:PAS domain S-box-containing protein
MSARGAPERVRSGDARVPVPYLEGKFLDFLETVPDAMLLSDPEGLIVLVNTNAERMFGYSRSELLGKEIEVLMPERVRSQHKRDRRAYYGDPSIRPMGVGKELYASGKDGVEFPAEISLSPVVIRENVYVWSAIRDIRVRKRSIAQLREVTQNKLTALGGFLSLCAWCKRILDQTGSWQQLDTYIESRSKIHFTHGICPDCLRKLDAGEDRVR